jgi:Transmembrane protein 43
MYDASIDFAKCLVFQSFSPMDDYDSYESGGDSYSETTSTNGFQEIGKSIVGMFVGLLLFLGSFILLFCNEGRIDFSQAAKRAIVIPDNAPAPQANGKTVAISGAIASPEIIGDPQYLKPAPYIALGRTVEMYAWKETSDSKTTKQVGGGKTTTKTYRYSKVWTTKPANSSNFKQKNYQNPAKALADQTFQVSRAKIGQFAIDMPNLTQPVPLATSCEPGTPSKPAKNKANLLPLTTAQLQPQAQSAVQLIGNRALFTGKGTATAPQVGDLRICYTALPNQAKVTVFGKLAIDRVIPATYGKQPFFKLFAGERQAAIGKMKSEYDLQLWGFRLLGFALMWVGLMLVAGPFSAIANVIPFVGDLVEAVGAFAAFIAAGLLSTVTILVSSLLHNPIALAASAVIALGVFLLGRKGILQFQR